MERTAKPYPEIRTKGSRLENTQKQLDHFAWLMDECFRIPGVGWRFGLEAIIGLVPGAGDMVTGIMGLVLLVRALQFKLPKIVIARMILNTLVDILIGAIPFLGDAFDFVWKSNTKNMKLFHEYATEPALSTRRHWVFIASLIGGFILLFLIMLIFLIWLVVGFYQPHP